MANGKLNLLPPWKCEKWNVHETTIVPPHSGAVVGSDAPTQSTEADDAAKQERNMDVDDEALNVVPIKKVKRYSRLSADRFEVLSELDCIVKQYNATDLILCSQPEDPPARIVFNKLGERQWWNLLTTTDSLFRAIGERSKRWSKVDGVTADAIQAVLDCTKA